MIKRFLIILVLFQALLISSFAVNGITEDIMNKYAPKLEIEYIIKTSKEYSNKQGYKTEDYFIQSIKYDSSEKKWIIFFNGKLPVPGNHFSIVINDETGEIQLFHGE